MSSPESKDSAIGKYISILYRYGRSYMDQRMSEYSIGSGQYSFLFYLYSNDNSTQDKISSSLCVDKATTTRALQKLETLGYISRRISTSDNRINLVKLTPEGRLLCEELKDYSKIWESILLDNIPIEEHAIIKSYLKILAENAINNKLTKE